MNKQTKPDYANLEERRDPFRNEYTIVRTVARIAFVLGAILIAFSMYAFFGAEWWSQ